MGIIAKRLKIPEINNCPNFNNIFIVIVLAYHMIRVFTICFVNNVAAINSKDNDVLAIVNLYLFDIVLHGIPQTTVVPVIFSIFRACIIGYTA